MDGEGRLWFLVARHDATKRRGVVAGSFEFPVTSISQHRAIKSGDMPRWKIDYWYYAAFD
jgi:hypothetical protein